MTFIDMRGKKFGYWTVLEKVERKKINDRAAAWLCRCKCGKEKILAGDILRDGSSKSCGCWSKFENGLERALEKKTRTLKNGCIEWMGTRDRDGYARYGEKTKIVTRLIYEKKNGKIPKNMCICHSCDNPGCVNIDHLWLGTIKENNDDKLKKGRCPHGSEHHKTHLKESDIEQIRILAKEGVFQSIIGQIYKISQATVSKIILNKFWTHVI